jgi:hypothetical protein
MFGRIFLRRVSLAAGIVAAGFASFVWYSTTQMQRGANELVAELRKMHTGHQVLPRMLELRKRYPAYVREEDCELDQRPSPCRMFTYTFENTWMSRLRLAPFKRVGGKVRVGLDGRLTRFECTGIQAGTVPLQFIVGDTGQELQHDVRVVRRYSEFEIVISMMPSTSPQLRAKLMDFDVGFLSRTGSVASVGQIFRHDLNALAAEVAQERQ